MCECSVAWPCAILRDSMDRRLLGSSVHGILLASILEWVAISSSRESSRPRDLTQGILHLLALAGGFFTTESPGKTQLHEDMMLGDVAALLKPQGATPEMKVSSLKW